MKLVILYFQFIPIRETISFFFFFFAFGTIFYIKLSNYCEARFFIHCIWNFIIGNFHKYNVQFQTIDVSFSKHYIISRNNRRFKFPHQKIAHLRQRCDSSCWKQISIFFWKKSLALVSMHVSLLSQRWNTSTIHENFTNLCLLDVTIQKLERECLRARDARL